MSIEKIGLNTTFCDRLNIVVESSAFKRKEIAEKLGVDPSTITGLLKGKNRPSFELLLAIAALFDVSLDWLTGREDTKICVAETHDPYEERILTMLRCMDDDTKRRVEADIQEKELLMELRKQRMDKDAA